MNTESVNLRRVKVPLEEGTKANPGDFSWSFDSDKLDQKESIYIYLCLPGESSLSAIQVQKGQPGGHRVWGWDGNVDKPTLMPSILINELWHGFLRNGRLESC